MRPIRLLVPLVAAGLVAAGVVAVTAGGQGSSPPSGTLSFTITTPKNGGKFVDVPPRGRKPTAGDTFYGSGKASGGLSGTVLFQVTFISGGNAFLHGAVKTSTGEIFVQEITKESGGTVRGAILGGTGAYAGARGDFTDKSTSNTKSQISVTFQ